MIICNYVTDFGVIFKRIRPKILGRNLKENSSLSSSDSINIISNWVKVDKYAEIPDNQNTCPSYGKLRKLIYQDTTFLIEVDYPSPFELDWNAINSEGIKIKTEPEFINHVTATLLLKIK